jgi:hypothetical protein
LLAEFSSRILPFAGPSVPHTVTDEKRTRFVVAERSVR